MEIFRTLLFRQPDLVDVGAMEDIKAYNMLQSSCFFLNLMKKPTLDNLICIWQQILSQNFLHHLLKYLVSWSLTVPMPGHNFRIN